MPGSHPARWIAVLLCGALSALGCAGTNTDTQGGQTGSLSLDLVLAGGVEIDEVDWEITGNGMDMAGSIDVSAPGSTASVEVFGLPPGTMDYTVTLTATSSDEAVTCEGSAPFNVEVGQSTNVMVMLNCKKPRTLGGVRVNGKFNICAELTKAVVSPLQTSVGNDISLSAQAFDEEGDTITYSWTGNGGSIADPTAASTTYTCQDVGDHTVTIMVTDNDVYCRMATWTIPVTCVEGDGGDLCEDVECEDDGNECTETACNPANGACETSNVADGTECDGGTCSGGACVEVDLCEGVNCDDQNECTADACDPADGTCSSSNVDNGTPCNNDEGVCSDGSCVDANLCEGVVCDDTGNDCTVAMCNNATGVCDTMDVTDGTVCNDGLGACSGGVCIDASLCDGVDCTSANDCVQDGTCDPASGECLPGDPQLVDTACASNGGSVCDGAGACVACNAASQCPDDGNDCTAAACETNACVQNNAMEGQACDFGGSDGMCEAGTCVAAAECMGPGDCDDGNPCTVDACPDGMCVYSPNDGGDCTVSPGVPGTCSGGGCVGLCEGVNCPDNGTECTTDICNSANGLCEPVDDADESACDAGTGPGSGSCSGGICQPDAVDPPQQSVEVPMTCRNSFTNVVSDIPIGLVVDPTIISGGQPFSATITPTLSFTVAFLNAALIQLPTLTGVAVADATATVQALGATGPNVSTDLAGTPCVVTPTNANGCPEIFLDLADPPTSPPTVVSPLFVALEPVMGNYTAGASGGQVCFDSFGTIPPPPITGTTPPTDTFLKVFALNVIAVVLACEPGTANPGPPEGPTIPNTDADRNCFNIQ